MSPGPLLKDTLKLRLLRYFGRREWIRYGVRFAVLRRFWDPYTPHVQTFELGFFDLRYQGDFECYLDWYVYFFGAYEKEELYLLRDLITGHPDPVFVDVGANIGPAKSTGARPATILARALAGRASDRVNYPRR